MVLLSVLISNVGYIVGHGVLKNNFTHDEIFIHTS